jgi:fatty acid desaturase
MTSQASPMSPALRAALSAPTVAWPTLALWLGALGGWGAGAWAVDAGHLLLGGAAMTLGAYLGFTAMHDASHRAVARRGWVNELVGRTSALTLLGPFPAFRYVHLEHHKHTNDPAKDPDLWSGRSPTWALPLRWVTQDLHYYACYLRAGRPPRELAETALTVALYLAAVLLAVTHGHAAVALAWVLSSRAALGVLAWGFDYLPHRPHQVTSAEDRYRATSVRPGALWQVLLVNQNLHLLHHLNPAVPFYRYGTLWREQREGLLARGVVVVNAPLPSSS